MIVDNTQKVWYKKYVPQRVDDIILPNELKTQLKKFIEDEDIPHLGLFSSNPGTGKSSTATAIITELGCETKWINASMDKGIDVLRGTITRFASQESFDDKIKVVVMDEFDNFTSDGQKAFRGFIDEFSSNCRFIFTGNYKDKIIEPLLERMEVYDFNSFSKQDMIKPIFERLQFILTNEGVTFDPKDLVPVINTYYPSIRSMVGTLQKYSTSGEFKVSANQLDGLDAFDKIIQTVVKKDFENMVALVNDVNAPDNMYAFLYKHMGQYFTKGAQPSILLIIARYQHMSANVRDKQLNLSACLAEIMGKI